MGNTYVDKLKNLVDRTVTIKTLEPQTEEARKKLLEQQTQKLGVNRK